MKTLVVACLVLCALLADARPAFANDDGGLSGTISENKQGDLEVSAEGGPGEEPPAPPVVPATISDQATGVSTTPGTTPSLPCAEWSFGGYDPESGVSYADVCTKVHVCGEERVDDVVSGVFASEQRTGRYRSFVDEMANVLGANSGTPVITGIDDTQSVNDMIISSGLNNQPSNDHIPVFKWCTTQNTSDGSFDPIQVNQGSLVWYLTYFDVYDLPGELNDLFDRLKTRLNLYVPEPNAVPPLAGGYTFVRWPTWFFLDNPLEQEHVYRTNDINTFRIDLRARLQRIEWSHGGDLVASCDADEMVIYDENAHHPIDDLPDCHYMFLETGSADLTTEIFYSIEQMVRTRVSASLDDFPPGTWEDFLGTPTTVDLDTTTADYGVHSIISVNIPVDADAEAIAENAEAIINNLGG